MRAEASGKQPGHPVRAGGAPGGDLGILTQLVVADVERVGEPGTVSGHHAQNDQPEVVADLIKRSA